MQRYTSANTSINSTKLPRIYSMVADDIEGKAVLDYGCGKYFDGYVAKVNADLSGYDKYNRPDETVLQKHFDFALCSNVLNVITEEEERASVLTTLSEIADTSFITVYEGDGSGVGRETKPDCYQLNRKTADYRSEISSVFDEAELKGKLWICRGKERDEHDTK